jgi:hypothetical protein
MSGTDQLNRTIDACRRAGLPVVDDRECTCRLRGRLVVLASPDGLRVLWPYNGRCSVHGPRSRKSTSASRATQERAVSLAGRT